MMRVMLVVMGAYLVGCYAYGLYLLVKVYTGRRMNKQSVAMSHDQPGFVLRETSETGRPQASTPPQASSDHAKAA